MQNKFVKQLKREIENGAWTGYVTYYPHKKAYKPLTTSLTKIWEKEKELNLYVHIPFCDKKCAYCNLFSTVLKEVEKENIYEQYVQKVLEEIDYYATIINKDVFIRSIYFGGGTPIVLKVEQLSKIMNKFHEVFLNWDSNIKPCIECAPDGLNEDYLKGLKQLGFKRVSIGIQTFVKEELTAVNRTMSMEKLNKNIACIKDLGLTFNLDLIYGLPYQTDETIFNNLKKTIFYSPDSICVYPLAIRKYTGMTKIDETKLYSNKKKYQLFDEIRNLLEQSGYSCQTVVRFIKKEQSTYQQQRLEYQGIPTLGVGAGARSYNNNYSYSLTYKVQDKYVRSIIEKYLSTPIKEVTYDGFEYSLNEQKRKFVMLTLLDPGLYVMDYKTKFMSDVTTDFKEELKALLLLHLIEYDKTLNAYFLTKKGRKYCDNAVDIFVSEPVKKLYANYEVE